MNLVLICKAALPAKGEIIFIFSRDCSGILLWRLAEGSAPAKAEQKIQRKARHLFESSEIDVAAKKNPANEWTGFIKIFAENYSALVASAAGASPSTAASVVSSSSSSSAPAPPFIAVLDILTATTTALSGCMKLKFSVLMSPT